MKKKKGKEKDRNQEKGEAESEKAEGETSDARGSFPSRAKGTQSKEIPISIPNLGPKKVS